MNTKNGFYKTIQNFDDLFETANGNIGPLGQRIYLSSLLSGEVDPALGKVLTEELIQQSWLEKQKGLPFRLPADPEILDGPLRFATFYNNGQEYPVGLFLNELPRHLLCVGPSGSGKTTLVHALLQSIREVNDNK